MEKLLEVLRSDEVLGREVREFSLSEPAQVVEFPLLYVEFSPEAGEEFVVKSSSLYERRMRFDICVVDRDIDPEKADARVFRLAERICRRVAGDPTLGGTVEDTIIERMLPSYGVLGDHAISKAVVRVACRVMWRA
ncbi:hypothetical protein DRO32_00775 [Candidatus Bathyarchaeota archaeon]|nr:MAG: hypothetical protein DRO32_00775 [Candidatus Bathyarchaeota archaeon]